MLAKLTVKSQITLPESVTQAVGATERFDVEARADQIILTPMRAVLDANVVLSALVCGGTRAPGLAAGGYSCRWPAARRRRNACACWPIRSST